MKSNTELENQNNSQMESLFGGDPIKISITRKYDKP